VWRADGDGIVVALKLRRAGIDDPLAAARLAREASVLRRAHHPALIALFDAGEDDGEPYLAFGFHDGPTLAERIDDGRLAVAETAAVFAPVAEALAVLHAEAIVHRDVKPANVLLTDDGPLLIDAGHASVAGTTYDGWVDAAPALAGTTAYLAPEAADTAPAPPLDVYALGISMLEAITGRADATAVAAAPEPIRALLAACTDEDPRRRPGAEALASALRALAGDAVAPRGRREREPIEPTIDLTALEAAGRAATFATSTLPVPAGPDTTGRALELARLTASARDGKLADELRAVLVTAPPGTGKSWLVDTAASQLEHSGCRVVRAACSPARGDVRVIGTWLLDLGRDAGGVSELASVAGRAPGDALLRATGLTRGGGETDVEPEVVADAISAVLTHSARDEPIVCIVEDLHHASLELLDLLTRLAERPGVPGALWCTTRPNWVDPDDLGFEVLALGPLEADAIAALVGEIGADAAVVTSATRDGEAHAYATMRLHEILAVAGGNPLHAREAALALRRGESLDANSTLPELIASRFASYEPPLRDALGLAAACGDDFWPEALGARFLDALPLMYRAGVAQVRMSSTLATSTEAHFRHPLLREVAYANLDDARRRELHGELGTALERAGAPAEIVAGQAGTAFRLGDGGAAPLAARAAAAAGRDALERVSLQAASEWIALLRETGQEAEPGLADLLDTELALDRGEYDRARELVGTDPDHGALAAKRLTLATRAAYGTGELADAARYGGRALELLSDSPVDSAAHAVTYGIVLSRTGRYAEALALLDTAASDARASGEPGLAARLAAEAADVAGVLVRAEGGYFTDVIDRTRRALAEQRHAGDIRRYIASAPAFVANLVIDAPEEALELAVDAAEKALAIGDVANVGPLAIAVCDTALEAEAVDALDRWLPTLTSTRFDATEQIEADFLLTMAKGARSPRPPRIDRELLAIADRFVELGDVTRADSPELGALCSLAWAGMPSTARELLEERVASRLPPQLATLLELVLRALEGPPWPLEGLELPATTSLHNERSLLHLLRGERREAEVLLRERYDDRLRTVGSARQRFSPYFPGALVAALGPAETEPQVDWLLGWIHDPPFPGLWIAHRAICALLLSERPEPPEPELADVARRLIDSTNADEPVRRWITERAERSASARDRLE
jgi:tetratricopeptide (TPR) repeat protein